MLFAFSLGNFLQRGSTPPPFLQSLGTEFERGLHSSYWISHVNVGAPDEESQCTESILRNCFVTCPCRLCLPMSPSNLRKARVLCCYPFRALVVCRKASCPPVTIENGYFAMSILEVQTHRVGWLMLNSTQ